MSGDVLKCQQDRLLLIKCRSVYLLHGCCNSKTKLHSSARVKRFDLSVERLNGFRPEMIRLCRVISSQIILIWIHSSQSGCEMHVLNLLFIISNESRSCDEHEKCIQNKPHLKTINSMHIMKRSSLIVRFLPSRTWRCYKPSVATQVCKMRRCCRHNKSHTRKTLETYVICFRHYHKSTEKWIYGTKRFPALIDSQIFNRNVQLDRNIWKWINKYKHRFSHLRDAWSICLFTLSLKYLLNVRCACLCLLLKSKHSR